MPQQKVSMSTANSSTLKLSRPNELGDEARSSVTELELTVINSTDDNEKTEWSPG